MSLTPQEWLSREIANLDTIRALREQLSEQAKEIEGLRKSNVILGEYWKAAESRVSALSAEVERMRLPEGTLAKHGSTITIEFDSAEYAIRAFDALEYAMSEEPAAIGERP